MVVLIVLNTCHVYKMLILIVVTIFLGFLVLALLQNKKPITLEKEGIIATKTTQEMRLNHDKVVG